MKNIMTLRQEWIEAEVFEVDSFYYGLSKNNEGGLFRESFDKYKITDLKSGSIIAFVNNKKMAKQKVIERKSALELSRETEIYKAMCACVNFRGFTREELQDFGIIEKDRINEHT